MRTAEVKTVGDEFPVEQARCRELLKQYQHIQDTQTGVFCGFAMRSIKEVLKRADQAAISGDVVAMVRSLEEMRGCE